MTSVDYMRTHNRMIQDQLAGKPSGDLTSSDKQAVVFTSRLEARPGRGAIYGGHRLGGSPIQPLSTVHGEHYADYSHGVRLVGSRLLVGGEERSIFDVLEDGNLAPLLTIEGPTSFARCLLAPVTDVAAASDMADPKL